MLSNVRGLCPHLFFASKKKKKNFADFFFFFNWRVFKIIKRFNMDGSPIIFKLIRFNEDGSSIIFT